MSGHSKWSKVKHQKATTDAVKSRAFTKASRALTVAVREGGGISDPDKNFRLRLAIDIARSVNMPKDTIDRAIEKGSGSGANAVENIQYEGYGPGGIAFLVETATDNRQRTGALVKHEFERAGGSLAVPGAVSFQFRRTGLLLVSKAGKAYDVMLESALGAGVEDVTERDDVYELYVPWTALGTAKNILERQGYVIDLTELIMHPTIPVHPTDDIRTKNEELETALETLEDVQKVFTVMD